MDGNFLNDFTYLLQSPPGYCYANLKIVKLVHHWFGLVCRGLSELKVPNIHFSLMCSIISSEVPTPFKGGARATELESSGALVERSLEWVLPLPGPGIMGEANWDVTII